MSCVTTTSVMPISSRSSASVCTITRCTLTSSAVVGSSAMTRSGLSAIAIAITTRCFIPPDSSCGNMRATPGASPTWRSSSGTRSRISSMLGVRAAGSRP